jgi:hypothetical protein
MYVGLEGSGRAFFLSHAMGAATAFKYFAYSQVVCVNRRPYETCLFLDLKSKIIAYVILGAG